MSLYIECHHQGAERPGEHCCGEADAKGGYTTDFTEFHQKARMSSECSERYLQVEAAKQPTIAIIVGQYYEKTAVDAMMTNRQTFVRYATVGGLATLDSFSCVVILYLSFNFLYVFCFL